MHEPRAHRRSRPGHILGTVDRDLVRARSVLQVGRVDHGLRANAPEKLLDCDGITDLDPFGRRIRHAPDELRAEVAGRAGDVQLHAWERRERMCRTSSTVPVTARATTNARMSPFHGCSSNVLPPT